MLGCLGSLVVRPVGERRERKGPPIFGWIRRVCFPVGKKQVVRSVRRGQGTEGSPNLRAARNAWVFLVGDCACVFGVQGPLF